MVNENESSRLKQRVEQLKAEKAALKEKCESLENMQKILEQAIGEGNQRLLQADLLGMELEQVFSSCADAMWVVREDGMIVRANKMMLELLGKEHDEVVGKSCVDLLGDHKCNNGQCPLKTSRKPQVHHEFEVDRPKDEGEGEVEHYLVTTASLVTLDGSPGIVAQYKDISLRKQAEEILAQANSKLEALARIDGLTQVANRRSFDEMFQKEWNRMQREKKPLSLILGDVDFFKKFNDSYGHQAGDDCLRTVAAALKGVVRRPGDLVARYGGEEFVILLPDTPEEGAMMLAEEARKAVEAIGLPHEASTMNMVTLSLGVATASPTKDIDPKTLIEAADKGLYKAKEAGRNRTILNSGDDR